MLALSFVMAMNYLAVMACPFVVDFLRHLFHAQGDRFPFLLNALLTLILAAAAGLRRNRFTLGLDAFYYKN